MDMRGRQGHFVALVDRVFDLEMRDGGVMPSVALSRPFPPLPPHQGHGSVQPQRGASVGSWVSLPEPVSSRTEPRKPHCCALPGIIQNTQ